MKHHHESYCRKCGEPRPLKELKTEAENARLKTDLECLKPHGFTIPQLLDAWKEARRWRDHWRERANKAETAIRCEHADPAGTIWEHAERLQVQLGKLKEASERFKAENARLRSAAQAVVDRWETPLWKDAEPTAAVIYRLRAELEAIK